MRSSPASIAVPVVLAVIAAGTSASGASAQIVRGRLVDPEVLEGIAGAIITLVDDGDQPLANTLTRDTGLFEVESPAAGRYRLKAERIGYATTYSEYLDVAPGDTLFIRLVARVRAVSLEEIEVEGDNRCRVRPEEGLAVTRVWDEARKALSAAAWTQQLGYYRYKMMKIARELDPEGRRVISESRTYVRAFSKSPYVSRPADTLIEQGFARLSASGSVYWAPDAAVLLSDPFLDTHCFRLRRDESSAPGLIGLGFEPVPGRRLPEIAGTLWLDPANSQLKWLDFTYVNLGLPDALQSALTGGRVEFRAMPNGTWIVNSWRIRMPRPGRYTNPLTGGVGVRIDVLVEEGGEVLEAHGNEGAVLKTDSGGRIAGIVFDSLLNGLPGARVHVEGTDLEVTTGRNGRFVITGIRSGVYTVNFSHPYLNRLGFRPRPFEVEVVEGASTQAQINFAAPTVRRMVERLCREEARAEEAGGGGATGRGAAGPGVLVGEVRDQDGVPVSGLAVRVTAREYGIAPDAAVVQMRQSAVIVRTNEWGVFRACGVPADTDLRVAALKRGWDLESGRSEAELLSARAIWVEEVVTVTSGTLFAIVDLRVEPGQRDP